VAKEVLVGTLKSRVKLVLNISTFNVKCLLRVGSLEKGFQSMCDVNERALLR